VRLKGELENAVKVSPQIRWGRFGQLDVIVDGQTIYSKQTSQRMPAPGEVSRLIQQHLAR
jgi:hypothetical protein